MKKIIATTVTILIFLVAIPALAALAITVLWNAILVNSCGFAAIGFWQGAGLFLLGQILTGGFVFGIFLVGGSLHRIVHHEGGRHSNWHGMTMEQRREFIERRRREHLGFRNHNTADTDAAE